NLDLEQVPIGRTRCEHRHRSSLRQAIEHFQCLFDYNRGINHIFALACSLSFTLVNIEPEFFQNHSLKFQRYALINKIALSKLLQFTQLPFSKSINLRDSIFMLRFSWWYALYSAH